LEENIDGFSPLIIASKSEAATGIFSFELRDPSGRDLPPFTPGAHLAIRVPNGFLRKYSLCNDALEHDRYLITVKREASGRGGSISLVDDAATGDLLFALPPENAFPLLPSPRGYIFIAGGIGITPVMSMIRHLQNAAAPFKLYYCTRSRAATAFADGLASPVLKAHVLIHHDEGDPARSLDLWPVLERPGGQHVYCCGPRPLMDAVKDMTGHWPASAIHFESFSDQAPVKVDDREFVVRIAGVDKAIAVPPGTTILEALRCAGFQVPSSCESGSCGTCRTKLLSGQPDHRDFVLSGTDRASAIMICVSRALSEELVVELS
jgi:phthalate 4,5-dioxygenase reductase subunit